MRVNFNVGDTNIQNGYFTYTYDIFFKIVCVKINWDIHLTNVNSFKF